MNSIPTITWHNIRTLMGETSDHLLGYNNILNSVV